MDADRFWGLLAGLPATTEWKLAKLEGRLNGLNDSDRRAFGRRFITESTALLTWRHIQAAEVIMGSVSEDVFVDFRSWVVLQGPEVSRAFLTDPDSMAAVGPTDEEEIGMAQVFEALATELLGDEVAALYAEPLGDSPKDTYEVLAQRYPRLAAAYLPSPAPTGTPWDSGPRPIRRRS